MSPCIAGRGSKGKAGLPRASFFISEPDHSHGLSKRSQSSEKHVGPEVAQPGFSFWFCSSPAAWGSWSDNCLFESNLTHLSSWQGWGWRLNF
jgi:hypothetical protein